MSEHEHDSCAECEWRGHCESERDEARAESARERALVEKLRADIAPAVKECREAREVLTADGWDMGSGYDVPGAMSGLIEHRDELRKERDMARGQRDGFKKELEIVYRHRDEARKQRDQALEVAAMSASTKQLMQIRADHHESINANANATIARLTQERDEARAEVARQLELLRKFVYEEEHGP